MSHIPQLVAFEYQRAYAILHEDLLFQSEPAKLTTVNLVQEPEPEPEQEQDPVSYTQLQAWKLKDDLDLADFGESWVTYAENAELVRKAEGALL